MNQKGMLLVLPVPFRSQGNQLFFELQACNGLEQWANNFESLIVAAPLIPETIAEQQKMWVWRNTNTLADRKRFELVPLPWAYSPFKFLSCYYSVRAKLAELIGSSRYLQFAIGGLLGDWAAVAALSAHQQGREYAIHTDHVEDQVMLELARGARISTQLKAKIMAPLIASYNKWIIQNCALGLWHGDDCYSAYSPFCSNNYRIHNIHTKPSDNISPQELSEKIRCATTDSTIRICYAGRMTPSKAPLDWVQAIARARDLSVNLHATWIGDGSLLWEMKAMIAHKGLTSCIDVPGFEPNRDKLLQKIRGAHIMLFTHVTPESPRCLLEALICGTPIIGYQSKYVDDLVKDFGGGMFVPVHNWQQLGDLLVTLSKKRDILSQLIQDAAKNGTIFNDRAVFFERSQLIKKYLS